MQVIDIPHGCDLLELHFLTKLAHMEKQIFDYLHSQYTTIIDKNQANKQNETFANQKIIDNFKNIVYNKK